MSTIKQLLELPPKAHVFPSDLGWMAVVVADGEVRQLTFGHFSPSAARKALAPGWRGLAKPGHEETSLVFRLQAFASGEPDDFRDVRVNVGETSDFRHRVLGHCRKIPYGHRISYAKLAAQAGIPHGARAVGSCMAANQIPLIIPCHRVVRSDGRPGSYSLPGGAAMKRRLLALESRLHRTA